MRKILLLAAASIVSAFCWGQVPDTTPPQELNKFGWMVGEWTSSSSWEMEGMPPMDVEATMKVEWDGQFMKHTTVTDFAGMMKMTETMMFGYDSSKKKYSAFSFTNMSPAPRIEWGSIEDDKLVMISEPWEIMGDTSVSRATLIKLSDNEFKFRLEFKTGDSWSLINEGNFKRKK